MDGPGRCLPWPPGSRASGYTSLSSPDTQGGWRALDSDVTCVWLYPSESRGLTPGPHTHTYSVLRELKLGDLSTPPSLTLALPQGAHHIVKEPGDVS